MQSYFPTFVTIAGSFLAIWLLINCIAPIKRLGVKSRKVAFILLIFDSIVLGVANNQRGVMSTAQQGADIPGSEQALAKPSKQKEQTKTEKAPVPMPKDQGQANILKMAKDKDQQDIWIIKGQEAVQEVLKDPSSAQFKKSFFHLAKLNGDYAPISCGQVNSKNSLGGYIGFQRYISAGKPELTFLEEEVADFNSAWKMMCVD